ncbi:MAG: hypothetical protein ACREQV_00915 [Candidatus Binatia bacterium]
MEAMAMKHRYAFAATMISGTFMLMLGQMNLYPQTETPDEAGKPEEKTIPLESATAKGVTLTIQCPETLFSGAENYVTITVRNDGDRPVEFYPAAPQFLGAGFEVTRQGESVSTTALGKAHLVPNLGYPKVREPVRMNKGQELRIVVNLTRYYDLSRTGNYQIVATWAGKTAGTEEPIRIRTKPLDFEVTVKPGETPLGVWGKLREK